MKAQDQILNWLSTHDLIKIKALEERCGIPQACIDKVINGKISLPERHIPVLCKELKKYGFVLKESASISNEKIKHIYK